jgi:hypothetical protein
MAQSGVMPMTGPAFLYRAEMVVPWGAYSAIDEDRRRRAMTITVRASHIAITSLADGCMCILWNSGFLLTLFPWQKIF